MPRINYTILTDRQLVDLILATPHNEEAAYYLILDRYKPALLSTYYEFTKSMMWYDDCAQNMYLNMRGKEKDWHSLSTFEWRSTFGNWLKTVAYHDFIKTLSKLIDFGNTTVSLDRTETEGPVIQIPGDYNPEEDMERIQRKILLLEAINKLDDEDKFIVLKKLKGCNSKEIASLLILRWKKYNIKKYRGDKLVVPNEGYVDTRYERIKDRLKEIMVKQK